MFSAVIKRALKGNSVGFLFFPHYLLCCRYWCVNMLSSLSSQPALFLQGQKVSIRPVKHLFSQQSEGNKTKTSEQQSMQRRARSPFQNAAAIPWPSPGQERFPAKVPRLWHVNRDLGYNFTLILLCRYGMFEKFFPTTFARWRKTSDNRVQRQGWDFLHHFLLAWRSL